MLEIRFHGRGGQGVVVGSAMLGMAFFYENNEENYVQFFPEFGVERRGAPLQAFLRVSKSKLKTHYNIYQPDHIIVFDNSLLNTVNVTEGLKPGGLILINSKKDPEDFKTEKFKVATIDADTISLDHRLGSKTSPITNAAMVGAFCAIIGGISVDSVKKAVMETSPVKPEQNAASAECAFSCVKMGVQL